MFFIPTESDVSIVRVHITQVGTHTHNELSKYIIGTRRVRTVNTTTTTVRIASERNFSPSRDTTGRVHRKEPSGNYLWNHSKCNYMQLCGVLQRNYDDNRKPRHCNGHYRLSSFGLRQIRSTTTNCNFIKICN